MLDIIVTHYNEPWHIGKKFFDMLACQQAADFDAVHVMVVHDGTEPFPSACFTGYPFDVEQITIDHAGVSAARNTGIEHAQGKWVQFCDFDDTYTSIFTLKTLLDVIEKAGTNYDILWGDFYSVDRSASGEWAVHLRGENVVFVHGKIFRRKWLIDSGLRFDTELEFNEDCLFCTVAIETLPKERVGHISTEIPFYTWCYTPKSATSSLENWWKAYIGGYQRNKKVVDVFKKQIPSRYQAMLARMVWDAYHSFNLECLPDGLRPYLDDFRAYYKNHKLDFWTTDPDSMADVMKVSRDQYQTGENEALQRWGVCPMKRRYGVKIKDWLDGLEKGVY